MKVGERGGGIGLRPELRDELIARGRALPIEQEQREELLRFARTPSAVADPRSPRAKLKRTEHERLNALGDRRRDRVSRRRRGRLQERREDPHVVGVELEVAEPQPQRIREGWTQ